MDLKLTGAFIKEQRKAKNLTQAELAEKLMVSEKTISKWECGNGFPDTTLMLPLCKELGISANELLSAKKLDEKEYKEAAESNLVELTNRQQKISKFLLTLEIILGYMCSVTLLVCVFVASYVTMPDWLRVLLIVLGFVHFVVGCGFCLKIEQGVGFYECKHCHHKYIPSYSQVLWSMHMGRTRYMKCPNCKQHSWHKKVLK